MIDHSPYISLKLKRLQVFLWLPHSGMSSYNSFYGKISEIIRFKHFKISAAQDKPNFGNCASLSRYVKKCYNVMILTRVRWFGSLIGKP